MPYRDLEIRRAYNREWKAKRRTDYLVNKCCVICGSTTNMEIDHIDRATKVDHRIWSWSLKRREAELAKCQVLCQEHHLQKTIAETIILTHGRNRMYDRGCRCELCREAKRIKNAKRKRTH